MKYYLCKYAKIPMDYYDDLPIYERNIYWGLLQKEIEEQDKQRKKAESKQTPVSNSYKYKKR